MMQIGYPSRSWRGGRERKIDDRKIEVVSTYWFLLVRKKESDMVPPGSYTKHQPKQTSSNFYITILWPNFHTHTSLSRHMFHTCLTHKIFSAYLITSTKVKVCTWPPVSQSETVILNIYLIWYCQKNTFNTKEKAEWFVHINVTLPYGHRVRNAGVAKLFHHPQKALNIGSRLCKTYSTPAFPCLYFTLKSGSWYWCVTDYTLSHYKVL